MYQGPDPGKGEEGAVITLSLGLTEGVAVSVRTIHGGAARRGVPGKKNPAGEGGKAPFKDRGWRGEKKGGGLCLNPGKKNCRGLREKSQGISLFGQSFYLVWGGGGAAWF